MKMHTTPEQTAKLIELGFEKPSPKWVKDENGYYRVKTNDADYDIGELIAFLPKEIDDNGFKNTLYIFVNQGAWEVEYSDFLGELYSTYRSELIDAIFDICVILKEEGVI